WVTRSHPAEIGLAPDGISPELAESGALNEPASSGIAAAVRTLNFWLILVGAALVIGAINAIIQHFILSMKDAGYSTTTATRFLSVLLASSLGGRVVVGYIADRYKKKNTMALFYLLI